MIDPKKFYELLLSHGVGFFSGVPDSLLKDFTSCLDYYCEKETHIIAANEGNALAIAMGHQMASGNLPMVYLQNSGLGNLINPLISLANKKIYSIPCLLLIGWRGEPGVKDEPQHVTQGMITEELLKSLGVNTRIISSKTNLSELEKIIRSLCSKARNYGATQAILVKKDTFQKYKNSRSLAGLTLMSREGALEIILNSMDRSDIVVSSTGVLSRELNELRKRNGQEDVPDFLTVGGMGHANQIALGVALSKRERNVFCFDGDGAALMHLGALASIANSKLKNYRHIIFNNGVHDSVGGQSLCAPKLSYKKMAKVLGYYYTTRVRNRLEIENALTQVKEIAGTSLIEVLVKPGFRSELSRPHKKPIENKNNFVRHLNAK